MKVSNDEELIEIIVASARTRAAEDDEPRDGDVALRRALGAVVDDPMSAPRGKLPREPDFAVDPAFS